MDAGEAYLKLMKDYYCNDCEFEMHSIEVCKPNRCIRYTYFHENIIQICNVECKYYYNYNYTIYKHSYVDSN